MEFFLYQSTIYKFIPCIRFQNCHLLPGCDYKLQLLFQGFDRVSEMLVLWNQHYRSTKIDFVSNLSRSFQVDMDITYQMKSKSGGALKMQLPPVLKILEACDFD